MSGHRRSAQARGGVTAAAVAAVTVAAVALTACVPPGTRGQAPGGPPAGSPSVTASESPATASAPAPDPGPATPSASAAAAPAPPVSPPAPAPGEPGARHRDRVALPADLPRSVVDHGAVPDDGQDDTAALRAALADGRDDPGADYYGRPKRLVFPPGVYDITDTLQVTGCCVTFQGSGTGETVLRVPDGAAGFGDAAEPRAVIRTIEGNMAFRNHLRDLTIDVGAGNPGAVGVDYVGNNNASVENVVLRAGPDSGAVGLDMRRYGPGPLLVTDLTVEGFATGIGVAHREYAPTLQRVTLSGQREAGIANDGNSLPMAQVLSRNAVPAVVSRGGTASVALLDSRLEGTGGAAGSAAVVSEAAVLLRDVTAPGYASVLEQDGERLPGTEVAEHAAGTTGHAPFAAAARTLGLPVVEAPAAPEVPAADWALFRPRGYNEDKGQVQGLFDSGVAVVAFPFETYFLHNEIDVPCSVRRVTGFGAAINGTDGVDLTLRVAQDCDTPLVVEDFGYGVHVVHEGARTVVLRHGGFDYRSTAGAGDLFLENVCCFPLTVQPGQDVWARQLNIEFRPLQIDNDGGNLWVLGYKTEGGGVLADTRNGGSTEIIGGLAYAIPPDDWDPATPAFRAVDSRQSVWISGSNYAPPGFYRTYVEETRDGRTVRVAADDTPGWRLFSGAADG